jgi:hypothetical protein
VISKPSLFYVGPTSVVFPYSSFSFCGFCANPVYIGQRIYHFLVSIVHILWSLNQACFIWAPLLAFLRIHRSVSVAPEQIPLYIGPTSVVSSYPSFFFSTLRRNEENRRCTGFRILIAGFLRDDSESIQGIPCTRQSKVETLCYKSECLLFGFQCCWILQLS